jgi:drug/metabolite transporter (DMT)-like permease
MPRTLAFTLLALVAFAANSLLARAAIGPGGDGGAAAIGPVGFTALRLAAGAAVLWPWWRPRRSPVRAPALAPTASPRRRVAGAVALVAYALPFSVAYVALGAATGALLLFGAVQLTMIAAGRRAGERLGPVRTAGLAAAAVGLLLLLAPGLQAPPLVGALAMLVAGVAWGAYSLVGRGEAAPLSATARNFAWALPAAATLALWPGAWAGATADGVALALLSGALTSGLGYVAWYLALPGLTRTVAATAQLAVPPIAALGAVALLGEPFGLRLGLASLLVLGGIAAVVRPRG